MAASRLGPSIGATHTGKDPAHGQRGDGEEPEQHDQELIAGVGNASGREIVTVHNAPDGVADDGQKHREYPDWKPQATRAVALFAHLERLLTNDAVRPVYNAGTRASTDVLGLLPQIDG